jgi:uncharacterized protein YggE
MNGGNWAAGLMIGIIAVACAPARAQVDASRPAPRGIAVSGSGTVLCRPDLVKIEVRVQSKAELTDDALVKYRDSRKRLQEAIDGLKLKDTRIVEQTVTISSTGAAAAYQAMMNGGGAPTESAQPTEIAGCVNIELGGVKDSSAEELLKTVGKVLDTAKDAGGVLGPSQAEMNMAMRYGQMPSVTTVRFALRDFKRTREQAYEAAVVDARNRATLLAKLYGVKLGRVLAVQELQVAGDKPETPQQQMPWWFGGNQTEHPHEAGEIVTDSLAEIPVNVRLAVRFEIAEPDGKTAAVVK